MYYALFNIVNGDGWHSIIAGWPWMASHQWLCVRPLWRRLIFFCSGDF